MKILYRIAKLSKLVFTTLICLSALQACKTAYVESGEFGSIPHGGYDNVTTNANTATVSFKGGSGDSPDRIRKLLLYRCAEVASSYGYDNFVVVSTSMSPMNVNLKVKTKSKDIFPPYSTSTSQKYQTQSVAGYHTDETRTTTSSCDQDDSSICKTRSAVAVIKMFNGPVPNGVPRAYAVSDIIAHYGPNTLN